MQKSISEAYPLTTSAARDLTLEAARDASSLRKPPTQPIPTPQLKKLLDSRHEREVLEGLRRVIAVRALRDRLLITQLIHSSFHKNPPHETNHHYSSPR